MKCNFKIIITLFLIISIFINLALVFKFVVEPYGKSIVRQEISNTCEWHMRAICNGFYRYAVVNKLDSPFIPNWCDELTLERPPICPADYGQEDIKCSYAINKNIVKYKFEDLPDDIVLFFESDLGWNGVGDKNDVNYNNHDDFTAGIVFADGYITHLNKEAVDKLRWE